MIFCLHIFTIFLGGETQIVVRGDRITQELLWHVKYLKSKGVKELYCLTTKDSVYKYKSIFGVQMVTIDELKNQDTSNMLLLIVNRESDFRVVEQSEDYREESFFSFRQRAKVGFYRERGVENLFSLYMNKDRYRETIELLADEESKKCFVEIMRCLIENDIYRGTEYPPSDKYFDTDIYTPSNGVWINCGAATGDTILHAVNNNIVCDGIVAVEIDNEAIERLSDVKWLIDKYTDYDMRIVHTYLQKGVNSIDAIFSDDDISLINMDVEGSEMEILRSAEDTIRYKKPVLAICAYHNAEDLINIPAYIYEKNSDYHFFLRKYKGCSPEVINEYIYYAVPTPSKLEGVPKGGGSLSKRKTAFSHTPPA